MQDEHKTKEQLIAELHELRKQAAESEKDRAERKRAKERLRESEERFSLAMEANRDDLWDWSVNIDTGYTAMLGYKSGEVPGHVSFWTDLIHPADKEAALKANMDCIENRCDAFDVEFRMQAKDGIVALDIGTWKGCRPGQQRTGHTDGRHPHRYYWAQAGGGGTKGKWAEIQTAH
jgi:PAS domain-containing protein